MNPAEQAVCADPLLWEKDAALQRLYGRLPQDAALRRTQGDWLRGSRDACGWDVLCIDWAYDDRIAAMRAALSAPPPAAAPRRPWCDAAGLNAAEGAICADDTLSNLDAVMAAAYGAARAATTDAEQNAWLRERDACGADRPCIGGAYVRRLTALGARLRAAGR
ncbi:uncharacterized protein DUF1311 [Hasllibacter halocynthiae]|uniref:Uncharacterized protein DUF1311 n=1 Tax=Hasllibacter halocynthiae TaxID=595589 RepID=A0A2T0X4A8_9RHOB|nr:lysozyme inhibitor LprI family protein [Hasllibacter halocynthiae]PRY93757.1 uncharacterized protein DUF1311 [Hasllibacter halocynthiae]